MKKNILFCVLFVIIMVFVQEAGITEVHGKEENAWYATNYGDKSMYFAYMDLDTLPGTLKAEFFVESDGNISPVTVDGQPVEGYPYLFSVKIPKGADYDSVVFYDDEGDELAQASIFDGSYNLDSNNTFYYRTSKVDGKDISIWEHRVEGTEPLSGKTLYFGEINAMDTPPEIRIGEYSDSLAYDETANVWFYEFKDAQNATQQTILALDLGDDGLYRFLWKDLSKNMVIRKNGVADVSGSYSDSKEETKAGTRAGTRRIYFDATFSKMQYENDGTTQEQGNVGIPRAGSDVVYCWAWPNGGDGANYPMSAMSAQWVGSTVWKDIYYADIPSECNYALFRSNNEASWGNQTQTVDLAIPDNLANPCFYADTADDTAYCWGPSGSAWKRSGYWAELYTVRDAEKYKNTTVVDVESGTFKRDSGTLYISATLYDYYTDFELNGRNRDEYTSVGAGTSRTYQAFRQFNQALSDYYSSNSAASPIYWGHFEFQYSGNYSEVADFLNLYGYNNNDKFRYENNSGWGRNGVHMNVYDKATIGLAASSLDGNGNLQLKSNGTNTTFIAPFFDEDFLMGNNSKNAVLGKIYENVKFPFIKESLGGVEYWSYHSGSTDKSNSNLVLKRNATGQGYYLDKREEAVNGNAGKANHFPFNDREQSGNYAQLNYGFGQKLEIPFRLTEDGTVLTTDKKEVPIEFTFSGDDDVWVFIDGEMVLDVGGGHDSATGTINFQDRKSSVSGVKRDDPVDGGYENDYETDFPDTLKNDTDFYKKEHVLTMFYMERGTFDSNMDVSFNFPDNNLFSVGKVVDDKDVNELFKGFYTDMQFSYNLKNHATHYGDKEVSDSEQSGQKTGFVTQQHDIPDYGSANSGMLKNVTGAVYVSQKESDTYKRVGDGGNFTIKNGETITFTNQFRRGSYIYLEETDVAGNELDDGLKLEDLFHTKWELYENGKKVSATSAPPNYNSATVKGGRDSAWGTGTTISDGRQEIYNGKDALRNAGYTETRNAMIQKEGAGEKVQTDQTIVFRSFSDPDMEVNGLNIKVLETNKVRTGSIEIKKVLDSGSQTLTGTYEIVVAFEGIGGVKDAEKVETKLKLQPGDSKIIDGIPAGTQYTITETSPADMSELKSVTMKTDTEGKPVGNDTVKIEDNRVTGTVIADDETGDSASVFIFENGKTAGYIFSFTKVSGTGSNLKKIQGAEFTLYGYRKKEGAPETYAELLEALEKAKQNGEFAQTWSEARLTENHAVFNAGTLKEADIYYLVETKAPAGMQLPGGCWKITYDAAGESEPNVHNHVRVEAMPQEEVTMMPAVGFWAEETDDGNTGWFIQNLEKWEVPDSGGLGTEWMYLSGMSLLIMAGTLSWVIFGRRGKKRGSSGK